MHYSKASILLYNSIVAFLFVGFIYLGLSYINLPNYWHISDLGFKDEFIFRHFFVVFSLFISIGIAVSLLKNNYFITMEKKATFIWMILFLVGSFWGSYLHILNALAILFLTLFVTKSGNKLFLILIPFFLFGTNSSYAMGGLLVLIFYLFPGVISPFIRKHLAIKIISLVIGLILICFIADNIFMEYLQNDDNALWRFMVWKNEINSLIQTNGTGVGFGSAYVTKHIYWEVSNSNMYSNDFGDYESGLFIVANHNSILNMFYRMGIIGGVVFFLTIIYTAVWFGKMYDNKMLDKNNKKYLYWSFVNWLYNFLIITLNPGLESPRFATGYLFSLGCLWGMLMYFQNNIIDKNSTLSCKI